MTRRQRLLVRLQQAWWRLASDVSTGIGEAQLDPTAALRWHLVAFQYGVRSAMAGGLLTADALERVAAHLAGVGPLDEGLDDLEASAG